MANETAYAGIDIGGTNIKFGLVNRKGQVIYRAQRPTMAEKGADPLMHLVSNIAEDLLFHAAEEELEVVALGVGTPGAVDNKSGRVIGIAPNIAGWRDMEIGSILSERLNMPIQVDNDVNCATLAEARFGAAVGCSSAVCVAIGTGVGGGIILDGKLYRGASHTAGEIGHMSIDPNGPSCRCGGRGCIEAFCASKAILERTRKKLKEGLTPIFASVLEGKLNNLNIKKLFAAAKRKDPVALKVIEETAALLGAGLSGIVNVINPQIVVIGGGVADGGGGFVEAVGAWIRENAISSATSELRISRAMLGNDAGLIGAGLLAEER